MISKVISLKSFKESLRLSFFVKTKLSAPYSLHANNLSSDDVAYLVPHQANKRIIDATAKRMGIGPEKVLLNIEKYGNTTAGTIP